jgi:CRISPR-associated protein Cmr3
MTDPRRRDDRPAAPPAVTALIQPRDPLVLRDARPFSADPGARAFSLPWPLPRTVAGALRTAIGASAGIDWNRSDRDAARRVRRDLAVHGPLLVGQDAGGAWRPYVPAPRDVVFFRDTEDGPLHPMVLRPQAPDAAFAEGCDLPRPPETLPAEPTGFDRALHNTDLRPLPATKDVKPETDVPRWWALDDAVDWLNDPAGGAIPYTEPDPQQPGARKTLRGLGELPADTRVHVSIDGDCLTNVEGALFTTEARAFPDAAAGGKPALAMACAVRGGLATTLSDGFLPLGGERRLARVTRAGQEDPWPATPASYPTEEQIARADGLRLLLVTPALFLHGWLPDWIGNGTITGLRGQRVKVKLVGAAIDRRIPVSGWRLATREKTDDHDQQKPGPRATRYAVPAGGVYFFAFEEGYRPDASAIRDIWDSLWLAPVSDHQVDRDDGFGLALPGLWSAATTTGS